MRIFLIIVSCAAVLIAGSLRAEGPQINLNPTTPHQEMMLGLAYWIGARGLPQDRKKGYELLLHAAAAGDTDAMTNIGEFYAIGEGVPRDPAKAMEWLRKAADRGDAGGYYNIGNLYFNGIGVPQDYAKAREYYEKALALPVDSDHREVLGMAANNIAVMYLNGWGVARDEKKAIQYYERAAEAGTKAAKVNLAKLAQGTDGVRQRRQLIVPQV